MRTIHIFGYGEAQIISDAVNFKAAVESFTTLKAVVDDIKSKKPADVKAVEYHAINIFDNKVDFNAKEKEGSFTFLTTDLNANILATFVAEFSTLQAKAKADGETKAKADKK